MTTAREASAKAGNLQIVWHCTLLGLPTPYHPQGTEAGKKRKKDCKEKRGGQAKKQKNPLRF